MAYSASEGRGRVVSESRCLRGLTHHLRRIDGVQRGPMFTMCMYASFAMHGRQGHAVRTQFGTPGISGLSPPPGHKESTTFKVSNPPD
eukprot:40155-Eustigmatos_ZCMA.PRE.1